MPVTMIVTDAGHAALVNAANNGTAPTTIAQFGVSETDFAASAATTELTDEVKRVATLSGSVVDDDTIHLVVRDQSADVFDLRSFALYLADGTLFAVYSQSEPILSKAAQSVMLLALDVKFASIDAAELTFGDANFINPPATTEVQGVVELATVAEAQAGIDALRALTPAGAKAAILGWLLAQDGSGSGLDADTVDGVEAAAFARLDIANIFTSSNYFDRGDNATPVVFKRSGNPTINQVSVKFEVEDFDSRYIGMSIDKEPYWHSSGDIRLGDKIWHAGNDGSGSGLDADTLDGKQASSFVLAVAYTAADVLSKLLGVDGAGSGVDADMLDGLQGIEFAKRNQGNVFTSVNTFDRGDNATPVAFKRSGNPTVNQVSIKFEVEGFDSRYIGMSIDGEPHWHTTGDIQQGPKMWHAANDGSGSGLDADTLDGKHASSFLLASAYTASDVLAKLLGVDGSGSGLDADRLDGYQGSAYDRIVSINLAADNGYIIYASGYKRCWGTATAAGNGNTTINWPISFDSFANASFSAGSSGTNAQDNDPEFVSWGLTSGTVYSARDNSVSGRWRAEGK